jgi:hypothetical protein
MARTDTIEPMTLGNMRANGVRSLMVYCGACRVPADRGVQRRRICGISPGAGLRPAHGVHRLRHDRRRRAPELA